MNCSYLIEGQPCGAATDFSYWNFAVCEEHVNSLYSIKRSNALQAASQHQLDAFPGICYIVLLPDATVKIGYSNTEALFSRRITDLTRAAGAPVILLLKIPGGFVAESVLHERFKDSRIPGFGERFAYSPEIAAFIAENGSN